MLEIAAYFDQHGGTPFPVALDLTQSWARGYLESRVHQTKVKATEAQQRIDVAVINRLDAVIGGLRALAKGLSGRR